MLGGKHRRHFGLRQGSDPSTAAVLALLDYTRVSTDQGLEQDFNSLDAQYDASQSYIRSQAHVGWNLIRAKYDDGGFSGGSLLCSPEICSRQSKPSLLNNSTITADVSSDPTFH